MVGCCVVPKHGEKASMVVDLANFNKQCKAKPPSFSIQVVEDPAFLNFFLHRMTLSRGALPPSPKLRHFPGDPFLRACGVLRLVGGPGDKLLPFCPLNLQAPNAFMVSMNGVNYGFHCLRSGWQSPPALW